MIVQKVENDQIASKFDFITPFINEYHNEKSLINGLDSLLSIHDINVKAIPFSCDKPPVEWFPIISGRSRKIKILKKYDGIQLFQMTCFFKEGKDHKEKSGLFFV